MKACYYQNIDGCTFQFSKSLNGVNVDLKLNDAFAQHAGYKDLGEFLSSDNCFSYEKLMDEFGTMPTWLPLKIDGEDSKYVKIGKVGLRNIKRLLNS